MNDKLISIFTFSKLKNGVKLPFSTAENKSEIPQLKKLHKKTFPNAEFVVEISKERSNDTK